MIGFLIGKVLKDVFTTSDNATYDNGRILTTLSMLVYYGLSFVHPAWGALEVAGGISSILMAGGVNLKLKKDTEPNP